MAASECVDSVGYAPRGSARVYADVSHSVWRAHEAAVFAAEAGE